MRALTADLAAQAGICLWLLDLVSPRVLEMYRTGMGTVLKNAPWKFAPPNGIAYFEAIGWKVAEVRSMFHAAARYRRLPLLMKLFAILPEPDPRKPGRSHWSGVVLLRRTN